MTLPQAIRNVDEFAFHQILRNVALYQCLSNGCSTVNGCRQNERPQVIHTTVHQLTSERRGKTVCFFKNQIHHQDSIT